MLCVDIDAAAVSLAQDKLKGPLKKRARGVEVARAIRVDRDIATGTRRARKAPDLARSAAWQNRRLRSLRHSGQLAVPAYTPRLPPFGPRLAYQPLAGVACPEGAVRKPGSCQAGWAEKLRGRKLQGTPEAA